MRGKHTPGAVESLKNRLMPEDDPRLRRGWAVVGTLLLVAVVVWAVVWVKATAPQNTSGRTRQPVNPAAAAQSGITLPPESSPTVSISSLPPTPAAQPSSATPRPAVSSSAAAPTTAPTAKKPAPAKPKPPQHTGSLTAVYEVGSNWDTGFIASITVTNNTGHDVWPTIYVHNKPEDGIRINQVWTGSITKYGDNVVFSNAKLPTGQTLKIGFDATKNAGPRALPSSCTIDGGTCRVS